MNKPKQTYEIQIVFPQRKACITVDFRPVIGEVIDHSEFGRGRVTSIVTFITVSRIYKKRTQMSPDVTITTVTKIILSELEQYE